MLRITDLPGRSDRPLLKLEGRLVGPWVTVLRRHCRRLGDRNQVDIDLAAVTFVDQAGLGLLRDLAGHGVELHGCSAFISELLNQKDPR
jgi:anti-anti-sigma regulatory factor